VEPAPRDKIVVAAARCGIPNFELTPPSDGFSVYVNDEAPNSDAHACIIEDVEQRQGYRIER
jgi:hypothetical protein